MDQDGGNGGQPQGGVDRRRGAGRDLGALIADSRRAAGLTQRELADLAGVGLGTVRDLEQGRSSRSRSLVRRAATLGLDAAQVRARADVAREVGSAMAVARRTGRPAGRPGGLWLAVLGPLEVWRGGTRVRIGPLRQRALLGLLAVSADELVRRESLIDALWGENPPATAVNLVQAHVSRLRRVLDPCRLLQGGGDGLLVSVGTSYRLQVTAEELDLLAFGQIVGRARAVCSAGDAAAACRLYEEALALWRGSPLADLDLLRGHLAVAHLARRHADIVIEYAQTASAAHCSERALPRLEALARAEPLNERAGALLMMALASAGRQDAALGAYQELRRRLDDQLGVRPGPELADAHMRVLRQQVPVARYHGQHRPADLAARVTSPSAVPRQLPPAVPHFTGRADELAMLSALLNRSEDVKGMHAAVVISAIDGTAGVGKTALAVQWARMAVSWFPDGQLYVNLRGYDPDQPMSATDALAGFLRALGVPDQDIPADQDERTARYRSLLSGRRMLVVLDNVGDVEQVRPLLPGAPACMTLVTSRDALAGLVARDGAMRLDLDLLPAGDAIALLRALVGGRADADPEAAAALAAQCARLPLALRIAAELAAARSAIPLAELARELAGQQQRLDLLDAAGDGRTAIRAVLSWSYQNLAQPAARLFRLTGLHPGLDITVRAAASLAGTPPAKAQRLLDELARAHLLSEQVPGRFGCHDLLRAYAIELATTTGSSAARRAALGRLLDYYLHTATAADRLLYPLRRPIALSAPRPGVTPDDLASHGQALAWLDAEDRGLLAAVSLAAEHGHDVHAWQLAFSLETFFYRRGHWQDWAATQHTALAAANRLGDRDAQALTHSGVANALIQADRPAEALGHLASALRLREEAGDVHGQARVHLYISKAVEYQGRYREALAQSRQALRLAQTVGASAKSLLAEAYNYIGWELAMLGSYPQALRYCQQAVALNRQLGNNHQQPAALDSLAYVHRHLGHHAEAADYYRRAVELFDEMGHRYQKAETLIYVGDAHHADGNLAAARRAWIEALAILEEMHHPDAERLRARLHQTYVLRGACSLPAHALAAPMAPVIALTAPAALGLSGEPSHLATAKPTVPESGTSTPMLMARSGHTSVRSLAGYARVSAGALQGCQ
jgi:DNA-binding SARP family transcriptional activator/DNA-binding XRE family transcriptional regulator